MGEHMDALSGIELVGEVRARLALGQSLRQSDVLALCSALEQAVSHRLHGDTGRRQYMREYMRNYRQYGPKPRWPVPASYPAAD